MAKSIIIIGAGIGGLSAGIYGRMNGFETRIFEMNSMPGGQCCSWKRQGFTFDGCIHHLFGCAPGSKINGLWRELGAVPRPMVKLEECTSVLAPDGRLFRDYYDLDRLESHLKDLAPADAKAIDEYIRACRSFAGHDLLGDLMLGSAGEKVKALGSMAARFRWLTPSMEKFGRRFKDPFLKRAVPAADLFGARRSRSSSISSRHAYGLNDDIQWPVGGALKFALSIEKRYRELGGEIVYNSRVEKILTENGRAVGVTADRRDRAPGRRRHLERRRPQDDHGDARRPVRRRQGPQDVRRAARHDDLVGPRVPGRQPRPLGRALVDDHAPRRAGRDRRPHVREPGDADLRVRQDDGPGRARGSSRPSSSRTIRTGRPSRATGPATRRRRPARPTGRSPSSSGASPGSGARSRRSTSRRS